LKKTAVLLTVLFCMLFFVRPADAKTELKLSAKSAVLMERDSGRVLYMDNCHDLQEMASTTKIMTGILAIEKGNLEGTVKVGKNASGIEGSSIWLSAGEELKLRDLLYGLMLASGNDAAVAIAEHIGGSVQNFVQMMNDKAGEIGAKNTHFANPNGLPSESHYTTAYDLALIACYAMRNPDFSRIVATKYKTIPWEGHEYDRVVKNKNKILWQYEGGNGVKTGYTKNAGKCLVAGAERDGMQLIAVVLDDGNMFKDCMSLLDYGFENYSNYTILEKGEPMGTVNIAEGKEKQIEIFSPARVCLPVTEKEKDKVAKKVYLEQTVKAPVEKGQTVGTVEIWLDGKKMYVTPLMAAKAVKENSYRYNFFKVLDEWLNKTG
jgi:D-alanyl-D-alanine carboxypeptidase (penicillin-binding protein 5/6)